MKKTNILLYAALIITIGACTSNTSPSEEGASDTTMEATDATPQDVTNVPTNNVPLNPPQTQDVDSSAPPASVDKNEKKYTSEKGASITAVYHDSGDMGVVELALKDEVVKLMKGPEKEGATVYTNGKTTWSVKTDGTAILEKDNVVTQYKEQ